MSARQELAVDTKLSDTAGDQVGVLRTKVQNENRVEHLVDLHRGVSHGGGLVAGGGERGGKEGAR